jgi:rhamnogalacturonyl hydrolase YesR
MGKITKDNKYFQHLDKLWWQTSGLLYDEKEHLFYRDLKFTKQDDGFQIKERNGKKIFWGRGNGWVMGALCRVLDYLPEDFPSRSRYESMFKEMCKKLLILQGDDGLWRSSLLDPTSYPMGETSSSTFYCYAFAWGINHNLLNSQKFKPALEKSWRALCDCVDRKSGKLGFVQLPAESPRSAVYKRSNVEYATGAFLLAGSEIVQLMP